MKNSNASASLGLMFSTATALVSPAHQAITRKPLYDGIPQLTVRSTIRPITHALFALLDSWRRRAEERRKLSLLDDHMLRDIGLDRLHIAKELGKPFWRS